MTLEEKQQHLREDFLAIEDPHDRLNAVVTRARRHPPLLERERTDAHRVPGCVSAVWLIGEMHAGRCTFRGDADGPLVRGLVVLLCEFFSESTAAEIAASDADPLETLDLLKNLSPTRRNGLASTRATIRAFAEKNLPADRRGESR